MRIKVLTARLSFFILLIVSGALLALASFSTIPVDIHQAKGLRAIGIFGLFLGIGEILNHPVQKKLELKDQEDTPPLATLHRSRNPCGLGNTLDVLALVCLFISLSYFFFPHQP